ncbi:helix-turn-helix domain-containing protein [Cryobacterium sp. RTS3]|uniref:helix-turn-helix domain-containing protein n=1 Tax=Cryobacterium sp. RTS3 TaxID=3048643 RepID=UPI002B223F55|nr:helix-turn-helix domain-containing protein [Cryobacterium sp. RTS3]MEB0000570.1 helix-turn-helix domain-containing protein [Cryobacterium sp. RTS3]
MVSSEELPTTDGDADSGARAHRIRCHLDDVLAKRGMTLTELSARTGITIANLSILKNNRAKAVRFTSLTLICDALEVQPAALFTLDSE